MLLKSSPVIGYVTRFEQQEGDRFASVEVEVPEDVSHVQLDTEVFGSAAHAVPHRTPNDTGRTTNSYLINELYRLFQKHQEYQQDASQDNQCEKNRENQIIWPTSHIYWKYSSYTPNSKSYSNNFSSTTAPVARIRSGAVSPGGAPFHGVDSPREDLVRTAVLPQSWTSNEVYLEGPGLWRMQSAKSLSLRG